MIVHAIPQSTRVYYGGGDWKAVESTRLLLAGLGKPVREIIVPEEDPEFLLRSLTGEDRHLLIEYTRWPDVIRQIRIRFPRLRIHVRTVNAEAFQHFHQVQPSGWPSPENMRKWYGCFRLLCRDSACRRHAETLLGISSWDDQHYWRWIPGRAVILPFPYFSPWPWLRPSVVPCEWGDRNMAIVCMPGSRTSPIGRTMMAGYEQWVGGLIESARKDWTFLLTHQPEWDSKPGHTSSNFTIVGDCREPWDLLCRVRAVAVLTPLGFGAKTTIMDGLAAGCHVLVHPALARRLEPCLRQACIVCDPGETHSGRLIEALRLPPDSGRCGNEILRGIASQTLSEVMAE